MKNWYKIAQSIRSVQDIAHEVRSSLLTDDQDTLQSLCLPVSRHLAKILIDNGYSAANVVQGTFTVDEPDPSAYEDWDVEDFGGDEDMMEQATYTPLHYWVQINDMVVDITADQFNDELEYPIEEVVIGGIGSLDRYNVITEDFIEPKIMF
jgi:hypothetical protein